MDDPWGSPWASTDTPSDTDPPPSSRAGIFLSPPPKAFFGNGTTQSPWSSNHDDGGLGVWTTADRADDTSNQNEWVAWADSGVQPPRLSPRLNGSGKESPLPWPENAAASPAFLANVRSRTPSILRNHSPDPWATELSLPNRSDIELPSFLKTPTGDAVTIGVGQVGEAFQPSWNVSGCRAEENANNETPTVEEEFDTQNDRPRTSQDLADDHANTSSKLDSTVYELPSRPSSTCTIDSHDQPERQDSPITSIDEDRGARMQGNLRKTSGKVQELVGVYDGLARAASEEPPTLDRSGVSQTATHGESLERNEIEDDEFGFGHFEDVLTDHGETARSPSEASSSRFSSTPKADLKDISTHRSSYEWREENTTETAPVQPQSVVNRFRDVSFDTNLSFVDKLFPDSPDSRANCSTDDWEIPDHVINDSFTTISERKGWYRISRYGSMRRHNSGGDESYHRVTWPTSQLHSDTIKIVRRWMEEDSYNGRATLGGTKRIGFFDWDSDAAPVELDEVFRRKTPVTKHIRTASIPANNNVIQTRLADERPYRNSTGISLSTELQPAIQPIMPVPSFSWNSEAQEISPTTHFSHNSSKTPNSAPVPAPVQTTFMDEDEDDWGEMVSTPRTTKDHIEPSVPAFPLPETTIKKLEQTPRLSLTVSDVDQPAGPKLPASRGAQPIRSDSWSFPDVSALDKSKQVPELSTMHSSETREIFAALETNTSLPNQLSFEVLKRGIAIKHEMPTENMLTGRVAVNKALKGTTAASIPLHGDKNQDDIIVQKILQNLPDLSYMLR
ncbi:hypothetical protein E0Z10_g5272 [Xylaria hypoxylon]|uniref:Uncharacterized protein n=1 Tax=Xylaria hypoxylon TaxID=37992 RepID=A0A4Z0YGN3_9PEZI|nr:hypothetical protein E0Z10_g5272 [Xylaria hypoxylon]